MGFVIPIAGWIERGYIGVFGAFFLVALVKGFLHIRAGRVALHREWMIRAFAIGLAVATQRLIFIPAILAVADPTEGPVATSQWRKPGYASPEGAAFRERVLRKPHE